MGQPAQANHNKIAAMEACIKHARALLESARAVQEAGHPNIAYHLAVLTLEELGRRELIGVRTVTDSRPIPPGWVQKHTQDHIKKLFWCFFGGSFFADHLTKTGSNLWKISRSGCTRSGWRASTSIRTETACLFRRKLSMQRKLPADWAGGGPI